jgi:hypothetical protein
MLTCEESSWVPGVCEVRTLAKAHGKRQYLAANKFRHMKYDDQVELYNYLNKGCR